MPTSTCAETSIPLPASPLDANENRVLLYELDDPATNEGWRMFSLADGSYVFEIQAGNDVVITEHHASFADASARVDRWYGAR